jgi:hypothetical protein
MPLPPPQSLGPRPLSTQTPEIPEYWRELLAALDRASIDMKIEPFAEFIAASVRAPAKTKATTTGQGRETR